MGSLERALIVLKLSSPCYHEIGRPTVVNMGWERILPLEIYNSFQS